MNRSNTQIETLEKELVPIVKNLGKVYQVYGINKQDVNKLLQQ